METILFKNKEYKVLEKLGDSTYKVEFKGKTFVIKTFHQGSLEFPTFQRQVKRLKISGVRIPKIIKYDKKNELALIEYISGTNMLDIVAKQDLEEVHLKAIFEQAWFAEAEKITLDYHPDNFILTDKNELYYLKYTYEDGIDDTKNFKTTYVKLWFFTRDFINYAHSKGKELDMSRAKEEYKINKEIVLAVVKYYI